MFRNVVGQSTWLYGGMAVAQLMGVAELAVLTRFLSLKAYGQLALIISYGATLNSLIDFRVWEALIKYFNEYYSAGDHDKALGVLRLCFIVDAGTGVIATILMVATANLVAQPILKDASLGGEVALYSLALLFATTSPTATGLLRVYQRFDLLGTMDAVGGILLRSATIIAAITTRSLQMVVLATVIARLIEGLLLNGLAFVQTRQRFDRLLPEQPLLPEERKQVLNFVLGTNVLGTLKLLTRYVDILLLGYFGGPEVSGVYKVAVSASNLHDMLNTPITTIAYPEIVRARQEGPKKLRSTVKLLTLISGAITAISGVVLFLFAGTIIQLVSNNAAYANAALYFRVMIVGNVVNGIFFSTGLLIMANERVWLVNRIHFARAIIGLALMATLIPWLGGLGASLIHMFNNVFVSLAQAVVCLRNGYISLRPGSGPQAAESGP